MRRSAASTTGAQMSDDTRPLATPGPTPEPPPGPTPAPRRPRSGTLLLVGAVVLVLVIGAGAFAAWRLLSSHGPRPEEVLPASTMAVVSLDLDPSAGQKVEAFRTLRKFPAWKDNVGADSDDDLLRKAVDRAHRAGSCKSLSFDQDLQPWLGRRAAMGAVPLSGDKVVPALAVQITDKDKARTGVQRLLRCTGASSDSGYAVGDDYVLVSDTDSHARTVLAMGEKKSLADDADYQRWTDAAGGHGVVDVYVAKAAAPRLRRLLPGGLGSLPSAPRLAAHTTTEPATLRAGAGEDVLKSFQGAAGTVQFKDGNIELDLAAGSTALTADTNRVGDQVTRLPGDTALALGYSVSPGTARALSDALTSRLGEMLGDVQEQTGLSLPADLETLLGKAITLSVGGTPPSDLTSISSPEDVAAGVLIDGDPGKIKDVIGRVEERSGHRLSEAGVQTRDQGDKIALATSRGYADDLLKSGSLGDQKRFRDAVPDADKAAAVGYADLDGPWATSVLKTLQGQGRAADEARRNLEPLRAVGMRSWLDGKVSHAQLRITLD